MGQIYHQSLSISSGLSFESEARCRPLVQYPDHLPRLLGLDPGGGEVLLYPEDLVHHLSLRLAHAGKHAAFGRINNLLSKIDQNYFLVNMFPPAM